MDEAKPFFPSTPKDHAAWVVALTITFLIYSILGVAARIAYRVRNGSPKSYDWFIIGALLVAFAQSILLIRACVNGLGKHQLILSSSALNIFHKEYFSASILMILAYGLAKVSVILFFMSINAKRPLKIGSFVAIGVIAAWTVSSLFVLGFRCGTSSPWLKDDNKCLAEFSVFLGIDVGNIITDIMLVVLPTIMMWDLQIAFSMKVQVIALFATRLLVPIILIIQIPYVHHIKSVDLTWTVVEPTIIGQIALSMSILTACIPSLKSGIEAFLSGASQFVVPTEYKSSHDNSGSHGFRSLIPSKVKNFGKSGQRSQVSRSESRLDDAKQNSFLRSRERGGERPHTIGERSESQTNLRDANITRTVEFEVSYENNDHPASSRVTGSDEGSYNSGSGYHAKIP